MALFEFIESFNIAFVLDLGADDGGRNLASSAEYAGLTGRAAMGRLFMIVGIAYR